MPKHLLANDMATAALRALPIGILITSHSGEIIFANSKAHEQFDYGENELIGRSIDQLVPVSRRRNHERTRVEYMQTPSPRAMGHGRVLPGVKKNDDEILAQVGLTPITLDGESYVIASVIEASNQILKTATHNDSLTGLHNRELFTELSDNLRNLAIRNAVGLSLLFVDLDRFKAVNDLYGHATGDLVLCEVADILRKSVRKNDVVGRIGGDEFLVCLYDIGNTADASVIADNMVNQIASIDRVNGCPIEINASIGVVTTAQPDNIRLHDMIKIADKLMYRAKKSKTKKVFLGQR